MKISKRTYDELNNIFEILEKGNFVLLKGSVGVGKTFYAKALANKIIDQNLEFKDVSVSGIKSTFCNNAGTKGQVKLVSFNKGTAYENFVYGISVETQDSQILYDNRKRAFIEQVEKAMHDKNKNYVLILDDINRADFSRAMGDVLSAIETSGKGRSIRAGGKAYEIPDNLYIIATYNPTIGNSVIDYAWLRRFFVFEVLSDERHIETEEDLVNNNRIGPKEGDNKDDYKSGFESAEDIDKLKDYIFEIYMRVKIMFERYFSDPDINVRNSYMLGHGMFLTLDKYDKNDKTWMKRNFDRFNNNLKHCIVPILYQYITDGLLDEEARFEVEAMEHLWDDVWVIDINKSELFSPRSKYKEDALNLILSLSGYVSSEVFLLFFLQGIGLRQISTNYESCYLFEGDFEKYKNGDRNLHTKSQYIHINGRKFYGPGLTSTTFAQKKEKIKKDIAK